MAERPVDNLRDAEQASIFFDDVKNKFYRRVKSEGEFIFTGLSERFRTVTQLVGDAEVQLPLSPLSTRKSLCIHNKGSTILYIGESGLTADSVDGSETSGWEVPPLSYFNVDTASGVVLYGRCETGKNTLVKILELS
jgi:hypothetical protein